MLSGFRFTGRDGDKAGVAGSDLLSGPGELTEVGTVFVHTYQDLQRCGEYTSSLEANSDSGPNAQIAGEY